MVLGLHLETLAGGQARRAFCHNVLRRLIPTCLIGLLNHHSLLQLLSQQVLLNSLFLLRVIVRQLMLLLK